MKGFDSSVILGILFLTLLVGTAVGWPLLIGSAARAGLMSRWFVAVAVAGFVGIVVFQGSAALWPSLATTAVLLVPILALARAIVLRDHPDEAPRMQAGVEVLDSVG